MKKLLDTNGVTRTGIEASAILNLKKSSQNKDLTTGIALASSNPEVV